MKNNCITQIIDWLVDWLLDLAKVMIVTKIIWSKRCHNIDRLIINEMYFT